ncbi:putative integrase/recombinase domain protein [Mycobacterium kansasii 824]|nr:putative integrase/recombinase domain protein [Mycobacterium kansasii 824]
MVSNFRPFLKFTGRADLVNALNLAGVKRFHAIVPSWATPMKSWLFVRVRRGGQRARRRDHFARIDDGIAGL